LQLLWLPLLWNQYAVGQFNDDGTYLGLARSLAQGLPYQDIFELGAPAAVRFPPGYPLALLPLQALFPDQLWLARLQSVFFSLCALWVFAGFCRRLKLPEAAWLLAANPLWALCGTMVMSESLFTLMLLLYLRALEKLEQPPRRRLIMLGLAAALCYYVRNVGLALVPATLLWRAARPWREQFWFLLGFWLGAGPEAMVAVAGGYGGQFHGSLADIWWDNLQAIPNQYGAALAGPAPALLFSLGLVGVAWLARRTAGASWTFCYLLLMLCWPFEMDRFVIPILPFLYLGMCALLPRRRLLIGLIILVEIASGLAGIQPTPPMPAASKIPENGRVACEGMIIGRATYAQPALDLLEKEWEWDAGMLDNDVQLVVLVEPNLYLAPAFQRRAWYRPLSPGVFEFAPIPRQRRGMLRHQAARAALKQNRLQTALWLFTRAEREFPEQASLHAGLARTHWLLRQFEPAAQQARRALELDPDNAEARGLQSLLP
jgi:hypothetical protein